MPELPEVETTVVGLGKKSVGQKIISVWTDLAKKNQSIPHFKHTIKDAAFFEKFKKKVIGQKITSVKRRGKNILIKLSNDETILIHMKMTGHVMIGKYEYNKKQNSWHPDKKEKNEALRDPYNRFIHLVFSLSNKKDIVLCDSRKFAKVTLLSHDSLDKLGPEPLETNFTLKKFKERLVRRGTMPIKQALMDQSLIVGIGNIYSDEILFDADIHPKRKVESISQKEFELMYRAMKKILKKGIDFGGDSMSDYRNIDGEPGRFHHHHNVYRKTGSQCGKIKCHGTIIKTVVGSRSAHFCNEHQK